MRTITITFTENLERKATETFVDFRKPEDGTPHENRRLDAITDALFLVLSAGCEGFATGSCEDKDMLRKKAVIQADIRRAGK